MNEHLQQLEALSRDPALKVSPEQRPAIVAEILHHLMWPYFLIRSPEMQAKFDEAQCQAFMRVLADYCLREYIEHPELRLTVEFIKGLHRQLYANSDKMPVRGLNGKIGAMVSGEIRTVPAYLGINGEWKETPVPPQDIQKAIEKILADLHDETQFIYKRYLHFCFDFAVTHPFADSNGKMALLLGDLYLLKQGIAPPYFAKIWWLDKKILGNRAYCYTSTHAGKDLSDLYPVLLDLYAQLKNPSHSYPDLPSSCLNQFESSMAVQMR